MTSKPRTLRAQFTCPDCGGSLAVFDSVAMPADVRAYLRQAPPTVVLLAYQHGDGCEVRVFKDGEEFTCDCGRPFSIGSLKPSPN